MVGKQFDINTKLPPIIRSYELDIRNMLSSMLLRGTIDLTVSVKQEGASKPMVVNTDLALFYYQGMKQIAEQTGLPQENIISTLMRMPEVVATNGVQDHEVSMAKASLMSIGKAVQDLMGRLGDTEKDIPGWIQDHITNAENYIVQASKGYYDQEDKKLGNNIPRPENQLTHSNNGK